jgi:fermentation-respiration switch protein FrsA (DUF1100 family)
MAEEVAQEVKGEIRKRKLRRFIIRLIIILVIVYAAVLVIGIVFQKSFTYFPVQLAVSRGMPIRMGDEEVWIEVAGTGKIHGIYRKAPEGARTILYLPGNAGNILNYSAVYDGLVDLGLGVLMIDYPGYGKSEGSPSEEALYASAHAALKFLESSGAKKENIVIFGWSLGTAVAVELASAKGFAGLILQSPFPDLATLGQSRFWFMPVSLFLREKYDSLARVGEVGCPLLVIVGTRDRLVPPAMSQKVFDRAKEPRELFKVSRAGHNDIDSVGGQKYWDKLSKWLGALKQAGKPVSEEE